MRNQRQEDEVDTATEQEIDLVADVEGDEDQRDKYLLFTMAKETYGIAIASITEIIEMQNITSLPDMPDYVRGVINLRGRIIPLVDLRLKFGLAERKYDDRTCTIIINVENTQLGFIVDTVAEVQDLDKSAIDPPPEFETVSGREHFVSGLGKMNDEVIILLEPKQILGKEELEVIGQTVQRQRTKSITDNITLRIQLGGLT